MLIVDFDWQRDIGKSQYHPMIHETSLLTLDGLKSPWQRPLNLVNALKIIS